MIIPIENLYYLLCYSWDRLEEKDIVNVDVEETTKLISLFAKVLSEGITHLFKRGFDRSYTQKVEAIPAIKGKLLFHQSTRRSLFSQGKAICEFDEFNCNVVHNQILKTTVFSLIRTEHVDEPIKDRLRKIYWKLPPEIEMIELNHRVFKSIRLHKNNLYYGFLMDICYTIYSNLFFNQRSGTYQFKDFLQDERKMNQLFESFVRNFYRREAPHFRVGREQIRWQASSSREEDMAYLPIMETDISLVSKERKIIIDTKYYRQALVGRFEQKKVQTSNLYQMYAYLKNVEAKDVVSQTCEGILLYPSVDYELDLNYVIDNHHLSIKTINLNQNWQQIHQDLLTIIQ